MKIIVKLSTVMTVHYFSPFTRNYFNLDRLFYTLYDQVYINLIDCITISLNSEQILYLVY